MEKPEERSEGKKLLWERPTVTLAGTISLLVRGGSALGKGAGNLDGDGCQFQAQGAEQCQHS